MSVYIDEPREAKWNYGKRYCRMAADSVKELDAFAKQALISRQFRVRKGKSVYYNLTMRMRSRASQAGAVAIYSTMMDSKLKEFTTKDTKKS